MLPQPNCSIRRCVHFQGVLETDSNSENQVPICAAFPEGIPDKIAYGNNLHLKPVEGDNGIQYEEEE